MFVMIDTHANVIYLYLYCSIDKDSSSFSLFYISLVSAFDSFLLYFVDSPMIQFYRGLIKMNLSFVILNKLCTVKIGLVFIYIYTIWVVCFYTLSMFICEDVVVYKCTVLNIWQLSHYPCIQDLQTFISLRRMHATIFMHATLIDPYCFVKYVYTWARIVLASFIFDSVSYTYNLFIIINTLTKADSPFKTDSFATRHATSIPSTPRRPIS